MVGKKRAPKRGKRTPIGDRVTFLAMMDKDVVADIKQVALDEHRAAWDVMEQAAREFLKRRGGRSGRGGR
ncbi:putative AAA+ superfamily ATPase [Bradyrhizobium diazoefficiens]